MNNLSAIGNIGRDAELRHLPDGTCVASWSFAMTSGFGAKKTTTWLNCSLFGKRAETLAPMLLKGNRIGITGEIRLSQFVGEDQVKRTTLNCRINDVTLLGSRPEELSSASAEQPASFDGQDEMENDIPF